MLKTILNDEARQKFYTNWLREFILWTVMLFSGVNIVIFFGFLVAGSVQAFCALMIFFGLQDIPSTYESALSATMAVGLKAVELLLLAPLAYVIVSALGNFVAKLDAESGDWREALQAIVAVKSLVASLLASIIAVDFVGKVLDGKPWDANVILLECLIFALLVIYLVVLEWGTRSSPHAS